MRGAPLGELRLPRLHGGQSPWPQLNMGISLHMHLEWHDLNSDAGMPSLHALGVGHDLDMDMPLYARSEGHDQGADAGADIPSSHARRVA